MPLSSAAIDSIFRRLLARYGSAWSAKWNGVPEEDVRVDWSRVLENFDRASLVYALDNLPEFVPNAYQFREICRRSPPPRSDLALPAPDPAPEHVIAELSRLRQAMTGNKRSRTAWIHDLEERERAGEVLSIAQKQLLREARRNLGWDLPEDRVETEADLQRTAALKAETAQRVADYLRTHEDSHA